MRSLSVLKLFIIRVLRVISGMITDCLNIKKNIWVIPSGRLELVGHKQKK